MQNRRQIILLISLWAGCLVLFAMGLLFGGSDMALEALLTGQDGILQGRLYRGLCAVSAGFALAISGLLLQRLTSNPLADPGITGVNSGAALAAVILAYFLPQTGGAGILLAAIFGSGVAGLALWSLAGGDNGMGKGGIALRLPLAGLAIQAVCLSLASILILTDAEMQARYMRWIAGAVPSVARGEMGPMVVIVVVVMAGFALCDRLSLLALGADQSHSLGRNPKLTINLALAMVILLSGASVAITGPIAFIGLLVPFLTRQLAPQSLHWTYLFALPLGAGILLFCDLLGRVIARPDEIDAGIIVALFGGPGLIIVLRYILSRGQGSLA